MATEITAALVSALRERTGAGIMDCKRALKDADGDIDAAAEAMRKSGQAKADKKADRITAEGIVVVRLSNDKQHAIVLEINSETDFVARDEHFMAFANAIADHAIENKVEKLEQLLTLTLKNGETVEEARRNLVAKVGENIQVRRYFYLTSPRQLASYVHGTRIAAIVAYEGGDETLGKDIAMTIVASNPLVVQPADVPAEIINKEKEIFIAQALNSGKPANIVEKMVEGRIQKFLDEVSLAGQPFIRDPEITVGKLLEQANAKVHHFVRLAVGEGIEKKTEDFAQAVMAQIKGS